MKNYKTPDEDEPVDDGKPPIGDPTHPPQDEV